MSLGLDPAEFRKLAGVQPEHVTLTRVHQKLAEAVKALTDYTPYIDEGTDEYQALDDAGLALLHLLGHLNGRLEQHRLKQEGHFVPVSDG